MYGLMVEMSDGEQRLGEVGEALGQVGFERVAGGVYVCSKPRRTEMLVVHDSIEVLRKLPWFGEEATKVIAFRIDELGDITNAFRES